MCNIFLIDLVEQKYVVVYNQNSQIKYKSQNCTKVYCTWANVMYCNFPPLDYNQLL